MSRYTVSDRWRMGAGAAVLLVVLLPLWAEFREPGQTGWNVFLAVFLIAVLIGAFVLQRYFASHASDIGEARFDTQRSRDG